MENIASFVKQHRELKNWSTRELGQKANMSHTEIHRIESGERKYPSAIKLAALSDAFNVPREELLLLAGYLKKDCHKSAVERAFPDLSKHALLAVQQVASRLADAELTEQEYTQFIEQVNMFIEFKKK